MSLTDDLRPARIAHILFVDIVSFTTLPHAEQRKALNRLNDAARESGAYKQSAPQVLPTGDGMALVYYDDISAPARCALDIAGSLKKELPVRMGIHSGLVQPQLDLTGRENLVGEGINTAHRVMECALPDQILLSAEHAQWLRVIGSWAGRLVDLGSSPIKHGLTLALFGLDVEAAKSPVSKPAAAPLSPDRPFDVVFLFRRNTKPDTEVLEILEAELSAHGFKVYCDRSARPQLEGQQMQEQYIRDSKAVIPIISPRALRSELLQYALETALEARHKLGHPTILPVQIGDPEPDSEDDHSIRDLISPFPYFRWAKPDDTPRLVAELLSALREPLKPKETPLEMVGGGMAPDSPYYIERSADGEFRSLLERCHSIVLVRGGRQIGKTSLLARGISLARERGWRSVRTDFQKLSGPSIAEVNSFYRNMAISLGRQCQFKYDFELLWDSASDPGQNFEYYLRDLIESASTPIVWFMDEVDKMFTVPFATDFFGLVRSWHNDRAAEPGGPLSRLCIVIAYATEAHLFISDLNQSPFNVGERLSLEDFSAEQVLRLNDLYGGPLTSQGDLQKLHALLGGHPYLTRRALDTLAREKAGFVTLVQDADHTDGPFADHLNRVLASVAAQADVTEYVRDLLAEKGTPSTATDAYFRLLRAGIVRQNREGRVVFRCELYRQYLQEHLG